MSVAEERVLQNVFWLIACEEDCAATAHHDECVKTARNIRSRVESWFDVSAKDFQEASVSSVGVVVEGEEPPTKPRAESGQK